ncbi:MAG: caspase family protein [Acidobacteriota bacterium]
MREHHSSAPSSSGRALVIGIDRYPRAGFVPLKGAVNDARRMAALLRGDRFGMAVTTLLDDEATRDAILAALGDLAQQAAPDAPVVIHFSGHGSTALAPSGHLIETLLPVDTGRDPHPNRDITGPELLARVAAIADVTPHVTLIVDACHSGGALRDDVLHGDAERDVSHEEADSDDLHEDAERDDPHEEAAHDPSRGAVRMAPPDRRLQALIGRKTDGPSLYGWDGDAMRDVDVRALLGRRYALIAACRPDEKAREMPDPARAGTWHGVLTCHLARIAESLGALDARSHLDIFELVATRIRRARSYGQRPQLEGDRDRAFLGVAQRSRPHGTTLDEKASTPDGPEWRLAQGLCHGVTVGSDWHVYPAGVRVDAAGDFNQPVLGRLEVVRVAPQHAWARPVIDPVFGDDFDQIAVRQFAVLMSQPSSAPRLRVFVRDHRPFAERRGSDVDSLNRAIDRAPWLTKVANRRAPCDLIVHRLVPRDDAGARAVDAVPQLGALRQPTWAVVDAASGRQRVPPRPCDDDPETVHALVNALERWARHRHIATLAPDPAHALRWETPPAVTVLRAASAAAAQEGTWAPAGDDAQGADAPIAMQEGECLALRIRHHHPATLHVYVLDCGLTGGVAQLYPSALGALRDLPGTASLSIGTDPRMPLQLFIPGDLPYRGETYDDLLETLVIVFATAQIDFGPLLHEAMRTGSGPDQATPADDGLRWTVVRRTLRVQPA